MLSDIWLFYSNCNKFRYAERLDVFPAVFCRISALIFRFIPFAFLGYQNLKKQLNKKEKKQRILRENIKYKGYKIDV